MKLSYRWLRDLVDLTETTAEQIARLLTFHAAEVEDQEEKGEVLSKIRTARVLSVAPHPDADRLRVCQVDAGEGPIEVVCGAPNVAQDQIVAFAPVGTTLTLPDGTALTLEARKVRGIVSNGMICAEDELGLGDDHDGILVLPDDTPVGEPFGDVMGLRDTIFDIGNIAITHRPDLWGHTGFARELSAILARDLRLPAVPSVADVEDGVAGEPLPVEIEDPADCRRYLALVLEGLENGPSPLWLRQRLEHLGVRSIDRIVDLTNWVLLEQGQPLHAFDLRDVRGGSIAVRRARAGETFKTLDDIERTLDPEDLVIADAEGPVAIAGVMGGAVSGVRPDTTQIVLESACFDPVRVRRTAARVGLRTDASSRFEKGLDPNLALTAALRFVALAQTIMPGVRLTRRIADVHPRPRASRTIRLPMSLVRRRLGIRIPDQTVKTKLAALGFVSRETGASLDVDVPSWRAGKDIVLPEDLVEEVGRIRGYDAIPSMTPLAPMRPRNPSGPRALLRRAGAVLSVDLGYHEVKNYSFYGPADVEALGIADRAHAELSHPYTEHQDRLVQTTTANLMRAVHVNVHRKAHGALWESGRLFAPRENDVPVEVAVLGGVVWDTEGDDGNGALFLNLVADVRGLAGRLNVRDLGMRQDDVPAVAEGLSPPVWLHPGRRAAVYAGDVFIGLVGEVAPSVRRAYDIEGRVACFELRCDALDAVSSASPDNYEPLLRYPVVPFDVSVLAERRRPAQDVADVIRATLPAHVRDVHCFDVYEGEGVPEGQRSLAFRCELFDREKTLSGKRADGMRTAVVKALQAAGFNVRGG